MTKTTRRRNRRAGVTLIEMLVVVMIIALFATLVGPRLFKQGEGAKITAAKAQLNNFELALTQFRLSTGIFPSSEQGLAVLLTKPSNVAQWDGPYLKGEIPNDPWGRPYVYKYPGDHGEEPDVSSVGPNGTAGDADDIVSWK